MELQTVMSMVQNFGALGILALMVWRSPNILTAITTLIENNAKNLREVQKEALVVFKDENDKIINMMCDKFEKVESALIRSIESNTAVVSELKTLTERVEGLERDKSK